MDPTKTDLARKFNDWYVYQVKNLLEKYPLIHKDKNWGHIGNILWNIDKMNKQDGRFDYGDCIIQINSDRNEGTSEVESYSGRIYYKGETGFFRGLEINFNSNGWYYTNNYETFYFNDLGPIKNVGVLFNKRKIGEGFKIEKSDGINGILPDSMKENSNGIEENNGDRTKRLRSGTPYGPVEGGRKSRKSRKSRKNKKQKNRKTNRR